MKHFIIGAAIAFALSTPVQAAQQLILGTITSETSHFGVGAEAFFDKLEELSGGEFTGIQAPAGQLGGERDLIEGLQIGSVDLAMVSTGPLGNFVPEVYAFDLPFLFRDYDHARKVLDGEIGQELLKKVDENNLVGLAWAENGFRHVTNNVHPVKTPGDLDGLKLRTMENKVHMAAFSGMGAAPTPMAFPEVFSALQQGVVDGQENPVTVISASKFWEVQKYASLTGHVYSPAIFLASPALFEGLSDEQKGWFYEAAKAGVEANRAEVNRLEDSGVAMMREHGMEVLTDVDKAPFAKLAEEASYAVYTDQYGSEMIERIKAVK
ncbi:TRAP transporter substrate-binding protein [Thalassospira sp. NFXS8]|uniref:TRAP transporter substrate-binding protein n=1 Tax=Thalassospira TaxID=168934 RepID=UPI0003B3C428|nr:MULTISPECIES: TRAP transporter substrate-binding protein [Thalassospira]MBV16387.1 C4-dicarboxylate ABC transporter substrate-binding protein [Thalassospira sp.]RCK30390.1 C4-dicarboxylate ABC transporter substrate-binding protein [Thalassospira lucentensis MCCC 1A00383 = DSM 14000]|tara:strand:- start:67000 stop:67968 length:969 start_codon:yes stop_codon:yes gene_type:complete